MTGLCDGGYFCSNRSISKTPGNLEEGGGPCPPGTYCRSGSPAPIECPPGKRCSAARDQPDGDCFPGYYCTGGSSVGSPIGGNGGDRCPLGAYCPEGSKYYTRCPPGTYADSQGKYSVIFYSNIGVRLWESPGTSLLELLQLCFEINAPLAEI